MKKRKNPETVIDLEYIRTFSAGDHEFVKEMVELYIEKIPQEIKALETAVEEKNWHGAYRATHDLKSSTSFIGMKYLLEDVLELEQCTKFEQDLEEVPELMETVVTECKKAIEELRNALMVM